MFKQHFLTSYLNGLVLLQEMDCNGYRKGNWKITKLIVISRKVYLR
jgi:hypothetical protein